MKDQYIRTALLFGEEAIEKLSRARVAVFGIGGVGGHTAEALVRCGIGHIDLIDNDVFSESNINRQIFALHSTVGKFKVDVARERLLDINPELDITVHNVFYTPEHADIIDFSNYDYVVDAIDFVPGKLEIIKRARSADVKIISSMGTGNKLDPLRFEIANIYDTSVCPLAKAVRKKCREMGIDSLKVIYSKELPAEIDDNVRKYFSEEPSLNSKRSVPASCAFVPSVAGLIIAGEVVKDLIKNN